ncbi:MAG: corrinoid protein [Anaerolineales bacterium]|nr:corrinoid protein [Anaerolineales bacterium]
MSEDIDITKLETAEILELIQDDLYDGLADEVVASVNELLAREMTPYDLLNKGLVAGMDIVGKDFRDGILFVPEVLMAAKAMKAGMNILRPLLVETGAPQMGTLVIGTVKGDIHDIGKNLVSMMMEGAGFNVINLGINTDVDAFLDAVREHKPDILGMSAMLTTTMPYMGVVIETLEQEGLREQLLVLVGGAPLNEAFAEEIRADAYCRDAAVGVETAKKMMAIKRGQLN